MAAAYKSNLVSGFIFYLIVLGLQCHDFSNFLIFGNFSLYLVPFEILSHYPNTDTSHWSREDVQGILDKVFRVELMI